LVIEIKFEYQQNTCVWWVRASTKEDGKVTVCVPRETMQVGEWKRYFFWRTKQWINFYKFMGVNPDKAIVEWMDPIGEICWLPTYSII